MEKILEVKNLSRSFTDKQAVNDLSFFLKKGEIFGFVGANGSGKTTTFKMLNGILKPSQGEIIVKNDFSINNNPIECKKVIGYLPEKSAIYLDMVVESYLNFIAGIYGIKNKKESIEELVELCDIKEYFKKPIYTLSKGYRQRVCLAGCLVSNPEILILDEPTDGLDPLQKETIYSFFRKLVKEKQKTILFSTHILSEIHNLCDRVLIIEDGKKKLEIDDLAIIKEESQLKELLNQE